MEEEGSQSQIFLFQPLIPTWTLGINTGANRQSSATAGALLEMPHCSLKPGCDIGHRAPKLPKSHSSEVSQGSVRITLTSHLSVPVWHYRKDKAKRAKRTPYLQQSSGNGQLYPDQGITPLALGRVAALIQICCPYCLSITELTAGQEPTLGPERLSSKINFVYSVGTSCAEDCSESPLQHETGINFFIFLG